ncbi:hypothetical protein QP175_04905 [Sphingomonas aerolata]|uniref:hypothetical protein n=1 Tax=Sphingomonas aerolata TaxID=185951 RepID=UPI002FE1A35B
MPLALADTQFESDLDALLRLQGVLLEAAEGARGPELDQEYKELRRILLEDTTYSDVIPTFVRRYRDLGSLWPAFKSFSPQWEPRRGEIRKQFEGALATAERTEFLENRVTFLPDTIHPLGLEQLTGQTALTR